MAAHVKNIPIEIEENNLEQGAQQIIKEIKPNWNLQNVEMKLLTDGITNKLLKCYLKDSPEDVFLIRVYGHKSDMLIDRAAETRNIILLQKQKLASNLYATFKNGLAYEFQPGITLTPQTVLKPEIYNLVAKHMAKLHLVKVENHHGIREPALWKKLYQFYDLVPDKFTDERKQKLFEKMDLIHPKQNILKEIKHLELILNQLNNTLVFAHNDLLLGNVIYNADKNIVTFIDYEYADINYQAFDIGNHFAEFQGIDLQDNDEYNFPSKDLQLEWIRNYLEEFYGTMNINDEKVKELYRQVNKFSLAAHIFWGLWALVQAEHSKIEFDYLAYGIIRFKQYFSNKDKLLSL